MIDWDDEAGHFAEHWARLADPARDAVAGALGPDPRVLDVGCGSGDFLARWTDATGIDVSPRMIELARRRAPHAALHVGRGDRLPFADGEFDAVTGFNSLQYTGDPVGALREWGRVARESVAVCAWAEPERCEVDVVEAALRELGGATAAPALGPRLEAVARDAGLPVLAAGEVQVPYEVAGQEELEVAFLMDARGYGALDAAGEAAARAAITAAAAPFRRPDGGYRFENVFRWVLASPG